ncbi:MAG: hypothetical protein CMK59_13855 [Proteobacteria bacterium]|nr:hypothetical protein [Pseudomonadota bacterium]
MNKIIFAQPITVGEIIDPDVGATWVFPVHHMEEWYVALGQQSDLWLAPLDSQDWTVRMEDVQNLSNHGQLIDHAFRKCPDGGFLHVGFSGFEQGNHFGFYNEDFELIASGEIDASSNDPSAVCGVNFVGFGTAEMMSDVDLWWSLNPEVSEMVNEAVDLVQSPRLTGAGMLEINERLFVIGRDLQPDLVVQEYDSELVPIDRQLIPSSGPGIMNYWPTAVEVVGEKIILLTMGRDPSEPWLMDTGDLFIMVMSLDWEVEYWEQLTYFEPEEGGGMRPWMDRSETTILVGFDRNNRGMFIPIEIDSDYFGLNTQIDKEEAKQDSVVKENGCGSNHSVLFLMPLCWGVGRFRRP